MLLVNYGKSQIAELHVVLYHGMGAYQNIHVAANQSLHHLLAPLALDYSCKQFHTHVKVMQEFFYRGKVLLCQYLGRSHHHSLEAVVYGYQHRHECHERLARTHVALYKAVHLPSGVHVMLYLPGNPLLCACQFKGQVAVVEFLESLAYLRQQVTLVFAAVVLRVA